MCAFRVWGLSISGAALISYKVVCFLLPESDAIVSGGTRSYV